MMDDTRNLPAVQDRRVGILYTHLPEMDPQERLNLAWKFKLAGCTPENLDLLLQNLKAAVDFIKEQIEIIVDTFVRLARDLVHIITDSIPKLTEIFEKIEKLIADQKSTYRHTQCRHDIKGTNRFYRIRENKQRKERLKWQSSQHARIAVRL